MSLRPSDISEERRQLLESGQAETSNLAECLAIDFGALAAILMGGSAPPFSGGILARMQLGGQLLLSRSEPLERWLVHPSDTVRGWAAYAIALREDGSLSERLAEMRPLAADPHFGVREWAWLALRPRIAAELDIALELLTSWTSDPDEGVRRFASEATRPRGVWCKHLQELVAEPERAAGILEPLRSDSSRYVRLSVGNWLNDAGKTRPDWVHSTTERWLRESPTKETLQVVKRARRNLLSP